VTEREPKERWLHTRISEALEDALKREAHRRRQPVSLFVRNVLEGALDLVEDIVETSIAASRGRRRPGAWRGLRERQAPPVFLCAACVGRLRHSTHNEEDPA